MVSRTDQVRAILHALSDEVRLQIVRMLAASADDLPCSALNRGSMPRSTASYHFAALRECGLISQYDRGNHRYNHLERERVDELAPGLLDAVLRAVDDPQHPG
ncbi:MAG TPA: helix-turn-helix domain-containing protein [Microlunatus sp.]|nr:helix-turn-helix domain-containing protein [Microlunatus sp.]